MNDLPHSWAKSDVGTILRIEYGQALPKRARDATGQVPVYGSSGRVGYHSSSITDGPTIVIGRKGSVGATYLEAGPCWPIDTTYFSRLPEGLYPAFVAYQLQSMPLKNLDSSTAVPSLRREDLEAQPLAIAPIADQVRIVAAIEQQFSRLDAGVAALERVKQNLKRMRAAVLEAAVAGRLSVHDPSDGSGADLLGEILSAREKFLADHPYPGSGRPPSEPDVRALPPLPRGWTWASVDQLSTRVTDGVHKKPDYVPEGIPFVTVRNLTTGPGISFANLNYVTAEDHAEFCRRSHPEFGDLLVSKDGTLGVIRAIRDLRPFSIFVSVALIKPALSNMTDYLEIALASPIVQRQMVPKGTGLQHIHLEDLRADCIPLPPLAQQNRIVMAVQSELSRLDHLEGVIESQSVRADSLRSSILTAAFAGRLVPQDPTDEHASALLDRLAVERVSFNGRKPGRPRQRRARREEVTA